MTTWVVYFSSLSDKKKYDFFPLAVSKRIQSWFLKSKDDSLLFGVGGRGNRTITMAKNNKSTFVKITSSP